MENIKETVLIKISTRCLLKCNDASKAYYSLYYEVYNANYATETFMQILCRRPTQAN